MLASDDISTAAVLQVKDRSSEFYGNVSEVRRTGSYIYEEFVETQVCLHE